MKVILFEDSKYKQLYPLSLLRPVYDIKGGMLTNKQRVESILKEEHKLAVTGRGILQSYIKELHPAETSGDLFEEQNLMLNGRALFSEKAIKGFLSESSTDKIWIRDNTVIAARLSKEKASRLEASEDKTYSFENFRGLKCETENFEDNGTEILNYTWDTIHFLESRLEADMRTLIEADDRIFKYDKVSSEKDQVYSRGSIKVSGNVAFDSSEGAIIIEENTVIEPFVFIKGPVFIGRNVLIKSGAKIYGPSFIGDFSKVAGEIGESIFHSFVNKQHEGFVGHSYICPFVNLGADTVTSDLKNNYSKIRMEAAGQPVETGMQFIGSILGDHSKTGINTMLNTGTVAGIFTNIFGGGFPPKRMVSFTWNEAGKQEVIYAIDKAVETARIVMTRRGLELTPAYEELVRNYFMDIAVKRDYPGI